MNKHILGSSILDLIIVDILNREGLDCDRTLQEQYTNEQSIMLYSRNDPEVFYSTLESIYAKNGFDACLSWFRTNCKMSTKNDLHWKNTLQEYLQSYGENVPTYRLKEKSGSDHRPIFTVEVIFMVNHEVYTFEGKGSSKKNASMNAAKEAYNKVFL